MKHINLKPEILGAYSVEKPEPFGKVNGRFISTGKFQKYLPILDYIQFKHTENLILTDGNNASNDIESYNRHRSSRQLDVGVVKKTKLDITMNEILLDPVKIMLNFTRRNITVSDSSGIKKTFFKMFNEKFKEYKGKALILTVYYFNNPNTIAYVHSGTDYFREQAKALEGIDIPRVALMKEIYTFLYSNPDIYSGDRSEEEHLPVRLVTMSEIDEDDLNGQDCLDPESGMLFSYDTLPVMQENPYLRSNIVVDLDHFTKLLENNQFTVYINDVSTEIADRYINIAGIIKKVPKTKIADQEDGLYIISSSDGVVPKKEFLDIESVRASAYVFRSIEEAKTGSDLKQLRTEEIEELKQKRMVALEELKQKYEKEKMERNAEHDETIRRLKKEQSEEQIRLEKERAEEQLRMDRIRTEELKARAEEQMEYERRKEELRREREEFDHRMEREKTDIQIEHERMKTKYNLEQLKAKREYEEFNHDYSRRSTNLKHNYEVGKYERDSTLETIKTVGSVVAAGAGILYLYTKVAK